MKMLSVHVPPVPLNVLSYCPKVLLLWWVCGSYVVHHYNGTGPCFAPPACGGHHGAQGKPMSLRRWGQSQHFTFFVASQNYTYIVNLEFFYYMKNVRVTPNSQKHRCPNQAGGAQCRSVVHNIHVALYCWSGAKHSFHKPLSEKNVIMM